jgi:hypothetical protein
MHTPAEKTEEPLRVVAERGADAIGAMIMRTVAAVADPTDTLVVLSAL